MFARVLRPRAACGVLRILPSRLGARFLATANLQNKVMLMILDGFAIAPPSKGNAAFHARKPNYDALCKQYLFGQLEAAGLAVGLPPGTMGNSEVGHLTIGSGRIEYQDLVKISKSIEDGSIFKNKVLLDAFEYARKHTGRVHFCGLGSDAGVHTLLEHLYGLLKVAKAEQVPKAFVHFFGDGRDTSPNSGVNYLEQVQSNLKHENYGKLATITGRYYAMDRDKRWERTKLAYEAMTTGANAALLPDSEPATVQKYIKDRYAAKETDEFLKPVVVDKDGLIQDDDVVIFFNFRADRMRQIVQTLGIKPLFETSVKRKVKVVQLTEYNHAFPLPVAFPLIDMKNVLAEYLSSNGVAQFHTSETEKYAHVTFFFNGKREDPYKQEDRLLVPSPKVATYDLAPEMSVKEVGENVVNALDSGKYGYVMCNLAAPDMVGHTGFFDKAVQAVEACDKAVGRVWEACQKNGYVLILTADHGNSDEMLEADGVSPKTAHTTNNVPFVVAPQPNSALAQVKGHPLIWSKNRWELARKVGGLSDVSPTILHVMGLPIPKEMGGSSMLK